MNLRAKTRRERETVALGDVSDADLAFALSLDADECRKALGLTVCCSGVAGETFALAFDSGAKLETTRKAIEAEIARRGADRDRARRAPGGPGDAGAKAGRPMGDGWWYCDCGDGYGQHRGDKLRCANCGCTRPTPLGSAPLPKGPAEDAIRAECAALAELLCEKNRKYGNSALEPVRVFSKASPVEQILVRLDDKVSRLQSAQGDEAEDTWQDLLGYMVLLRIALKRAKVGAK